MPAMMSSRRRCSSSSFQEMRAEFWLISRPDTDTPPALAALPGANRIWASLNTCTPSSVVGMLAPSDTAMQPLPTRVRASSPVSSFWVAHGRARSQGTPQGVLPTWNSEPGNSLAYSEIRPRRLFLQVLDPVDLVFADTVRIVDEALGVRERQHLAAQLVDLLRGVGRHVAGAGDHDLLAFDRRPSASPACCAGNRPRRSRWPRCGSGCRRIPGPCRSGRR